MRKKTSKTTTRKLTSSVEQAINDAKWDKRSSWEALVGYANTAAWKERELAEVK